MCRAQKSTAKTMEQVDVDDSKIQATLGKIQMGIIRKAEKEKAERAKSFILLRKKHIKTGIFCASIAIGIYAYTIFAIKQETFLDDFDMPDPIPEED